MFLMSLVFSKEWNCIILRKVPIEIFHKTTHPATWLQVFSGHTPTDSILCIITRVNVVPLVNSCALQYLIYSICKNMCCFSFQSSQCKTVVLSIHVKTTSTTLRNFFFKQAARWAACRSNRNRRYFHRCNSGLAQDECQLSFNCPWRSSYLSTGKTNTTEIVLALWWDSWSSRCWNGPEKYLLGTAVFDDKI